MKKIRFLLSLLFVFLIGCTVQTVPSVKTQTAAIKSEQTQKPLSPALEIPTVKKVGFDVDDTLLFSTPAFERGFSQAEPYTDKFWEIVNTSDKEVSKVKEKTLKILKAHQARGQEIYIVTARNPEGGEALKKFLNEKFGVPENHIFFEPHGKAQTLKKLGIDVFYGDSDSDITAAKEAGAIPIRIERSPQSSYKGKYHPGEYGEFVIPESAK
ncbi:MAG: HAD family hydrolase [Elusimicrobia bacterium]|nr:HAD family hydrolase [Elusimicrobiota bacterium]